MSAISKAVASSTDMSPASLNAYLNGLNRSVSEEIALAGLYNLATASLSSANSNSAKRALASSNQSQLLDLQTPLKKRKFNFVADVAKSNDSAGQKSSSLNLSQESAQALNGAVNFGQSAGKEREIASEAGQFVPTIGDAGFQLGRTGDDAYTNPGHSLETNEVSVAKEERRREQRRISARNRRQSKRDHLQRAEFECNKLAITLQAYKMQLKALDSQQRVRIGRALGVVSRINRRPIWQEMMNAAHEKLVEEEKKRTAGVDLASRMRGKGPKEIRRERNRLSAKMSRLRKRVRLDFLQKTSINLKAQISCLEQHLNITSKEQSIAPNGDDSK